MKKKKILYISHEKSFGGATKALLSLIKEAQNRGHEVYVLVPKKNCIATDKIIKTGVHVISFPYGWWEVPQKAATTIKFLFKVMYRLNWLMLLINIKKIPDVDIIHSNSSVIDIGAKIANKLNKPHIWHFREFYEDNLTFIKGKDKSYKYVNNSNSEIIYVSKDVSYYYSKYIYTNKSTIVYDGIEIKKCKEYNNLEILTFLIAGSIQESKGQEIAIQAVDELIKRGYKDFKLIIAGGDPEGFKLKLEKIIFEKHIEEYIEFIGFVNDMESLRGKVDIELICSRREAFGLCTAEAMMFGNLVIGSASGATAELINNKETGLLFNNGDYIDLEKKLESVINNKKVISILGQKAHVFAKNNLSETKSFDNINEIYKRVFRG